MLTIVEKQKDETFGDLALSTYFVIFSMPGYLFYKVSAHDAVRLNCSNGHTDMLDNVRVDLVQFVERVKLVSSLFDINVEAINRP